jgi:hypothetical protein
VAQENGAPASDTEEDDPPTPENEMPLRIVVSRITVVSGMSFAAALAIFFLVGALWLPALVASAVTTVFLILMFAIERTAE